MPTIRDFNSKCQRNTCNNTHSWHDSSERIQLSQNTLNSGAVISPRGYEETLALKGKKTAFASLAMQYVKSWMNPLLVLAHYVECLPGSLPLHMERPKHGKTKNTLEPLLFKAKHPLPLKKRKRREHTEHSPDRHACPVLLTQWWCYMI